MNDKIERFEDMRIWREARALVGWIYSDFRENRDWGFRDQLQRAGVSVMNNIAEGFERNSDAEFARFLDIAKGSAGEVRSMYYATEDLKFVSAEIAEERRMMAVGVSKGIGKLVGYLRSRPST